MTGLGKTLSVWTAIADMPERDVLVICPKGAVPQWRRTISHSKPTNKRVTILNFEKTKSLMAPPPGSTRRSTRAKNNELAKLGALKRTWPLVVIDEAHRIRNPNSQQGMVCRKVADAATFTIYMSATAGQAPHELSYLSNLFAAPAAARDGGLDGFRALMKRLESAGPRGVGRTGPGSPTRPIARQCRTFFIAALPPSECDAAPRTSQDGRRCSANSRPSRSIERPAGFMTRPGGSSGGSWVWRAGARESRRAGRPISGSVRRPASCGFPAASIFCRTFWTTGCRSPFPLPSSKPAACSSMRCEAGAGRSDAINGTQSAEANEAARLAFQTGELDAIVFTVTESISLHRGEMPGGERERSLLVHDMRHSAIQLAQIEGRCHRDGQHALIYYAYAEDTVEETIAATVIGRMSAMGGMAGDDTRLLDEIAEIFDQSDA